MPFYRDPGNMMPQRMQDILAAIGMRDPRGAVGMPMMTIGPRAIPLDQPQRYVRKVLGETIGDLAEGVPSGQTGEAIEQAIGRGGPEAASFRSWFHPDHADAVRKAFGEGAEAIGDGDELRNTMNQFDDRLVNWLANLFYGSGRR